MSEILSRREAVRAFLDGKKLELNYKGNKGDPAGWVPLMNGDDFWHIIAQQSSDFRVSVPKAAFEEGEFAYLVSYGDAKDGRRYAGAFSYYTMDAMFVRLIDKQGYSDYAHPGFTYVVVSSDGTQQTVHERDLRKASEVAPILIDE